MLNSKYNKHPLTDEFDLSKTPNSKETSFPYRTCLGMLQYLLHTRPDIETAVNILAQFAQHPEEKHATAMKSVLRYLNAHRDLCITYRKNNPHPIFAVSDASHPKDNDPDVRSRSGYIVFRGGGGGAQRFSPNPTNNKNLAETQQLQSITQVLNALKR